ncbi:EI24 domain-containing protein [Akkermansiaceae bacterium]|nr:EI24 domain-containing protein [Akkermansiaceae bacterium]
MISQVSRSFRDARLALILLFKLRLWKYFAIPILIALLTAVAIVSLAWGLSGKVGGLIAEAWVWEWGAATMRSLAQIIGGLIVFALGLLVYKHIVLALASPFVSSVSEKVEAHLYPGAHQYRNTSNASQLVRGVKINLRNLCWEFGLTIPILLVGIVPVVGFFSAAMIFLIQAYYAGFGSMDCTLERHFGFRESVSFVKANRGAAIGNGIIFTLLLFIPVIGIILVLPISVTAASVSALRLINDEEAKAITAA